jgi:hypothetical protein
MARVGRGMTLAYWRTRFSPVRHQAHGWLPARVISLASVWVPSSVKRSLITEGQLVDFVCHLRLVIRGHTGKDLVLVE